MPLAPLPPTDTRPFFRPVAAELVALLRELPPDAWDAPTIAGTWRVRDVVAHLLDVGLRRLSFHRDRHPPPAPDPLPRSDRDFVAFINRLNRQWVEAAYRATSAVKELVHICGAGDSFREPGAKDAVARHACGWLCAHFGVGPEARIPMARAFAA